MEGHAPTVVDSGAETGSGIGDSGRFIAGKASKQDQERFKDYLAAKVTVSATLPGLHGFVTVEAVTVAADAVEPETIETGFVATIGGLSGDVVITSDWSAVIAEEDEWLALMA